MRELIHNLVCPLPQHVVFFESFVAATQRFQRARRLLAELLIDQTPRRPTSPPPPTSDARPLSRPRTGTQPPPSACQSAASASASASASFSSTASATSTPAPAKNTSGVDTHGDPSLSERHRVGQLEIEVATLKAAMSALETAQALRHEQLCQLIQTMMQRPERARE